MVCTQNTTTVGSAQDINIGLPSFNIFGCEQDFL